jgi:hypothetical protein
MLVDPKKNGFQQSFWIRRDTYVGPELLFGLFCGLWKEKIEGGNVAREANLNYLWSLVKNNGKRGWIGRRPTYHSTSIISCELLR